MFEFIRDCQSFLLSSIPFSKIPGWKPFQSHISTKYPVWTTDSVQLDCQKREPILALALASGLKAETTNTHCTGNINIREANSTAPNTTLIVHRLVYVFCSSTWTIPGVKSSHTRTTYAQTPTVLSISSPVTRFHVFFHCHHENMPCLNYVPWILFTVSTGYWRLVTAWCYADWQVDHGKSIFW